MLPIENCELTGIWCCKEPGTLEKQGVGFLRKYGCLGGLKTETSGTELQTKFCLKGLSLGNFVFIQY